MSEYRSVALLQFLYTVVTHVLEYCHSWHCEMWWLLCCKAVKVNERSLMLSVRGRFVLYRPRSVTISSHCGRLGGLILMLKKWHALLGTTGLSTFLNQISGFINFKVKGATLSNSIWFPYFLGTSWSLTLSPPSHTRVCMGKLGTCAPWTTISFSPWSGSMRKVRLWCM